jgi:TRAP-type mannitol/chloroaromatic compound transport system permease small subunit
VAREVLNVPIYLLGATIFVLIFISNWGPTLLSWKILEIEGEGALQVPVYPVRSIILLGSAAMIIHFIVKIFQSLSFIFGTSKRGM